LPEIADAPAIFIERHGQMIALADCAATAICRPMMRRLPGFSSSSSFFRFSLSSFCRLALRFQPLSLHFGFHCL
jgi:hypothetical protein